MHAVLWAFDHIDMKICADNFLFQINSKKIPLVANFSHNFHADGQQFVLYSLGKTVNLPLFLIHLIMALAKQLPEEIGNSFLSCRHPCQGALALPAERPLWRALQLQNTSRLG